MSTAEPYTLQEVDLSINNGLLRIRALCCGPRDAMVWVRAWLSNEEATLAETVLNPVKVGTRVTAEVRLPKNLNPDDLYTAYIRIESSPLQTQQVIRLPLLGKLPV
jgi:hypothetical protein